MMTNTNPVAQGPVVQEQAKVDQCTNAENIAALLSCESAQSSDLAEQDRMAALAALPDSDDDKYQSSSRRTSTPRTGKSGSVSLLCSGPSLFPCL